MSEASAVNPVDAQVMQCRHCGAVIKHYEGRLYHDEGLIFPQYCRTTSENGGAQLHEPIDQGVS